MPGTGDRLGAIGNIELAIDTGCVGFDGSRSHDELPGDILVGPAQGHELENFQLTPGEWFNQPGWMRSGGICLAGK